MIQFADIRFGKKPVKLQNLVLKQVCFHHVTFCVCRIEVGKNKYISIPVEETNDELMRQLKQKIALGTYQVGNLIVPQVFEKVAIKDDRIVYEKVTIAGRKIPLLEIRKELLDKNNKYMRLRTNDELDHLCKDDLIINLKQINEFTCNDQHLNLEALIEKLKKFERTRYLMMWHDCATVGGQLPFDDDCVHV